MRALGGTPSLRGKPAATFDGKLFAAASLARDGAAAIAMRWAPAPGAWLPSIMAGRRRSGTRSAWPTELHAAFPAADVEYYFGGQKNEEYVVSFDE